jgi:hypothetical protein
MIMRRFHYKEEGMLRKIIFVQEYLRRKRTMQKLLYRLTILLSIP